MATVAKIEGRPVQWYLGIVSGDAALDAGALREACMVSSQGVREVDLREARERAMQTMLSAAAERGANAVLGVGFAYEPVALDVDRQLLLVTASGTAVRV